MLLHVKESEKLGTQIRILMIVYTTLGINWLKHTATHDILLNDS
jgi:hypothetical protein